MTAGLQPWGERQRDYANLFNPASVGLILRAACDGYTAQMRGAADMPFPLAFVAVPLSLSPYVRRMRPRNVTKRIAAWCLERPEFKAEFVPAAQSLAPFVKEGISFAVRCGVLTLEHARLCRSGE